MENNTDYNIEILDAFYVTREEIKPVKAFTMKEAGSYGTTETTWYLAEKGWKKAAMYSTWQDVAWTQEEADKLQEQKLQEHIQYLKNEREKYANQIAEMEAVLQTPKTT